MEEPKSTKIIETCKVTPYDSPSQFSLPLTFLDKIWLSLDPASRVFFYEFPEPNTDFSNIILPKLKHSLSYTLRHYLPLAGHLTWPQGSDSPVVQYSIGDGVSLTVAKTEADFHSLSGDDFRESMELRSLLPDFPTSETRSLVITLKITLFPQTGFSVAYVAHHAVADGKSVALFLHSWAYICKKDGDTTDLPPELTPSFNRTFADQQSELEYAYPKRLSIPSNLENKALSIYDMNPPLDVVLGTFKLKHENIKNLKKSVLACQKENNKQRVDTHVSSFTIASAYVMVCLVKALEIKAEKTFIAINMDGRARLDPQLSSTYFGNCVLACGNGGDTKKFFTEDGFLFAVDVVNGALDSINEGVVNLGRKLHGLLYSLLVEYAGVVVAGSPRFELYKVDFGWGKPRKVDMVSIDKTGAFCLSDHRDGNGGIEIGVGIKKHQVKVFSSTFANGLVAC